MHSLENYVSVAVLIILCRRNKTQLVLVLRKLLGAVF